MKEDYNGIEYSRPSVVLLNSTGLGVPEIAARTCYDSFKNSENDCIKDFNINAWNKMSGIKPSDVNNIENSELLEQLAWVHHHHSIIEHTTLSYFIQGTSRGVLQEHARHRIQAISVKSTRYTMSNVINAFISSKTFNEFWPIVNEFDLFVTTEENYNLIEIKNIWDKLKYQQLNVGKDVFIEMCLSKENQENLIAYNGIESKQMFNILQKGKKKRNVGDSFKHIVTDNWKVDMVVTFNLRSLKNYFDLRDSGAAWFQIRWLAEEMQKVTPLKYLKLISKKHKDK